MKGLAIAHAADELNAGQEYITTLRDRGVLDESSEDELENEELQMSFKQRQANRNKERLRQHANKGLVIDDNQWAEPAEEANILSKYDDITEQAIKNRKQNRMRIGQSSAHTGQQARRDEEAAQDTEAKIKISSDYYTKAEDPLQGSKLFKKKKRDLVGKKRKRDESEEDDIIATLEKEATDQLETRGQRKEAINQAKLQAAQAEQKKESNFNRAFDRIKNRKEKKQDGPAKITEQDPMLDVEEEEYALVQSKLSKQRQLQASRKPKLDESFINNFIVQASQEDGTHTKEDWASLQSNNQSGDGSQSQPNTGLGTDRQEEAGNEVVTTSEFDSALASIANRLEKARDEGQLNQNSSGSLMATSNSFSLTERQAGLTSVVNVSLPSQLVQQRAKKPGFLLSASTSKQREEAKVANTQGKQLMQDNESAGGEDQNSTKNELDELLLGRGIGNALKVMRVRGALGVSKVKGRNLDQSCENQLRGFNAQRDGTQEADRIKLKHFDKKGRELSMKEAFRQQCWKFHGIMPSHRKREKMAKKEEVANKIAQAHNALGSLTSGVKPLGALGALQAPSTKIKKSKK